MNGFAGPSQMVLLEPSRMVHDNWVWVWVQTVVNGVAEAVANGSRRLGLSLGRTVANGVAGPSRMVLPDRREWLSATVWELSATVRLNGDWVWE